MYDMGLKIQVNLPYLGYFFVLYYLLVYTRLPIHIQRAALIFHRFSENNMYIFVHGEQLYEDLFDIDENLDENKNKNENENEDLFGDEDLIVLKEEARFEDKYLTAFKSFSNDYFFNEEELKEKANKLDQLKRHYDVSKEKNINDLLLLLLQTEKIVYLDTTNSDNLNEELIKYFDLEDEFKDDPSNFDLDELLNDLKNDHNRFTSEIKDLNEDIITEAEFSDKALKHVLDKKLDGFINNYILEYTPLGNIYMRYNNFKKSFEYFSNNTIPYRYLEAVGRKYVMTFRCKALFVDLEDEMQKAAERYQLERDNPPFNKPTVVSKFKSWDKDLKTGRPVSNNKQLLGKANLAAVNTSGEKQLLKENANRYTWEGRLANFSVLKKVDRKTVDKSYTLSFADFKQMSQIKK
jgi:hypothetical protein